MSRDTLYQQLWGHLAYLKLTAAAEALPTTSTEPTRATLAAPSSPAVTQDESQQPVNTVGEPPDCMWVLVAVALRFVASGRSLAGLAHEPSATFGLALPGYAAQLTADCGLASAEA